MERDIQIPEKYRRDVDRAVAILREAGCSQIFVFGSLTTAEIRDTSDIDLAIRGCPRGRFFHLLGRLLLELEHPVDLVDLDRQNAFAHHLERAGGLLQVG
jgi:predicted nucleotidyltransferase